MSDWWLLGPGLLLLLSAWYGQLTMDPYRFGAGRSRKQIAIGIVGMYTALALALLYLIWRD